MVRLDNKKLASLSTLDDKLDERYGAVGSARRNEFEAQAKAWYYAELLREERKRRSITQKTLAELVGMKREYISALEKGKADMQLSTFLRIAEALGLHFSLVVG